jgi:hypothetical protein
MISFQGFPPPQLLIDVCQQFHRFLPDDCNLRRRGEGWPIMEKAVLRKMEIAELGWKLYRTYRRIIGIVQAISEVSL